MTGTVLLRIDTCAEVIYMLITIGRACPLKFWVGTAQAQTGKCPPKKLLIWNIMSGLWENQIKHVGISLSIWIIVEKRCCSTDFVSLMPKIGAKLHQQLNLYQKNSRCKPPCDLDILLICDYFALAFARSVWRNLFDLPTRYPSTNAFPKHRDSSPIPHGFCELSWASRIKSPIF